MDLFFIILGFICIIVGVLGSFLPLLPGVPLAWLSLVFLKLGNVTHYSWWILGLFGGIVLLTFVIDYFLALWGVRKFGGSRYGMIGAGLGLLIGSFLYPPFGIILGPFIGAFLGEMLKNTNQGKKALKAAIGSTLGFLLGVVFKISVSIAFAFVYFKELLTYFTP